MWALITEENIVRTIWGLVLFGWIIVLPLLALFWKPEKPRR